jgi:hypothetical protein
VIVVAVRWYLRYGLSYRDVEGLLAERGIDVDHVTVYRWVQRFTPLLADAARFARHAPGGRRFVGHPRASFFRACAEPPWSSLRVDAVRFPCLPLRCERPGPSPGG